MRTSRWTPSIVPDWADQTVYLDPTFFTELESKLGGSKADFSQAYVPHMDKEHGRLISLNVEALK